MMPRIGIRAAGASGLAQTHSIWARETRDGAQTEDRVSAGDPTGAGPYFFLAARRLASLQETSLFVATVRESAKAGFAIDRFGSPASFEGRFGSTETARVSLAAMADRTGRRECVAWRANADATLVMSGLLCLPDAERSDSEQVECFLRDLVPTGAADPALRVSLKPAASAAPPGCGATLAALARSATNPRVARPRH